MKKARNKNGFTLLEVMIALAIIAGALVVILHGHLLSVNLANRAQGISRAGLLAQEKMEGIIKEEGFPEEGEEEGGFEKHPHFRWRRVVEKAELFGEEIEELRRVAITIFWFDGIDEGELEIVSYLFRGGG